MLKVLIISTFFLTTAAIAEAQDPAEIRSSKAGQFLLRGYYHAGLEIQEDSNTFLGGNFAPIFLWKQSDRLLFEGELEIRLEAEHAAFEVEYANMSYLLTEGATLQLGKFILPFGIFAERLHPNWINRFSSFPLGFGHDGIAPFAEVGAGLRRGFPVGSGQLTYSLYGTNGPRLNDGAEEPEEAGKLHFENFEDNNKSKAFGGRIGILPISDSSLELGLSGQYAKVGDADSEYEGVAAQLYAVDLSLVRNLRILSSVIDIKGQWNHVQVDDAMYPDPDDSTGTTTFTFDNTSDSYFVRLSIRPAFLEDPILRNFELVGRYSSLETPEGSHWGGKQKQWAVGLNYWLDWRSVIKLSYQNLSNGHGHEEAEHGEAAGGDLIALHWAMGF